MIPLTITATSTPLANFFSGAIIASYVYLTARHAKNPMRIKK